MGNVPNNNDPHGAPHVCWNSVSSIAVDDSGIIYAVGYGFLDNAFSGSTRHWIVKKSTDGGDSWTTVDDYQYYAGGDAAARKVTVDSWGNVTVIGWANNNDGGHWVRLLITRTSNDGGSSWTTSLSGSDNDTVTDESGNIYSITPGSVDPWNSSYYANNPGTGEWVVQKSIDGGINWTTVDYVSPEPGGSQANAIKIDPFGNIYVAGYKTVLSNNSSKIKVWLVRKSIDDGATWTTVDSGGESWPGGIVTNAWHSVIHDMAIDSSGIVYVAANGCSGQCWLVRQSKNEGATWTTIDKVGPLDNSPSGNLNAYAVAVDSDDRPYVGGYSSQLNYKSHWFVRILEP